MILKTQAIVIKEYTVGESDKFITLFTKDLGKIQVTAPRAKKYDKGMASGTQLFVYGEFMLAEYKDTYRLMNVEILYMFHELRNDLLTLSYGSYVLEFIELTVQQEPDYDALFYLTLVTLKALIKGTLEVKLIRCIFELKALSLLGFMPELEQCIECVNRLDENRHHSYFFSSEAGGIICEECALDYPNKLEISYSALYTMKYIIHTSIKHIYSFRLEQFVLKELEQVCHSYTVHYVGKVFKTATFIGTLEG